MNVRRITGSLVICFLALPIQAASKQTPSIQKEAISPDGRYKAVNAGTVAKDSQVILIHDLPYERRGGQSVVRLVIHSAPVIALAFSPDSRRLATQASDGTVRLWAINKGGTATLLSETHAPHSEAASLSFTPKGDLLLPVPALTGLR